MVHDEFILIVTNLIIIAAGGALFASPYIASATPGKSPGKGIPRLWPVMSAFLQFRRVWRAP